MPVPLSRYVEVPLTSEQYAQLTPREQAMLPLLIDACREMDAIFWQEAYGDRDALLGSIADPERRRLAELNYGPWDRLDDNLPFIDGVEPKPAGAAFYPPDMTRDEFEAACGASPEQAAALRSPYTLVRRDSHGALVAVPYHVAFAAEVGRAAAKLRQAAELADDPGLRQHLELRAAALLDDEYRASDLAWLDMKDNGIDIIIGPIEQYEDALFGAKAAHEGIVLLKDRVWSARLNELVRQLPELQRRLPVPDAYKREMPGSDSDLGAYDAVYLAGQALAPAPAAIALPNDEDVQVAKGTRRLQLGNIMRAAFESKALPTARLTISLDQRGRESFDAYFQLVLLHEVAHGLGIKHTLGGRQAVREALREHHSAIEEAKADMLGLHLIATLEEAGTLAEADFEASAAAFLTDVFRHAPQGFTDVYARQWLASLGFLRDRGAVMRDPSTGTYSVDRERMRDGVAALAAMLLTLQGDGDRDGAAAFLATAEDAYAAVGPDLDRLAVAEIPRGTIYRQGMDVLVGGAMARA
jgi:Peptidase family M49